MIRSEKELFAIEKDKTMPYVDTLTRMSLQEGLQKGRAYSDANRTPIRFEVGQRSDSKRTVFRLKSDSRPG